ncbi:MAG: Tad domain-containing protein [Pseudomonadota bacterium]
MRLKLAASIRAFRDDVSGAILMFVLALFLLMTLSIGMAIDFMRHETARADLQNALDRGTLAATAVTQTLAVDDDGDGDLTDEYTDIVYDYMMARSFNPSAFSLQVTPRETIVSRSVYSTASYALPTSFLNLAGISELMVKAESYAEQGFKPVEVSLVFDVSGSMGREDVMVNGTPIRRLAQAKLDAKQFVADLRAADPLGELFTINLVPYSGKVGLPDAMKSAYTYAPPLGTTEFHPYGWCMDLQIGEYRSTSIDPAVARPQFPHFLLQTYNLNDGNPTPVRHSCSRANNTILPFQTDVGVLQTAIDNLDTEEYTATYEGVKWGVAMLDPVTRDATPEFITNGLVAAARSDLPYDYSPNVSKVLVVLSDGENTHQPYLTPTRYSQDKDGNALPSETLPHDYWHSVQPTWRMTRCGGTANSERGTKAAISKFNTTNNCRVSVSSVSPYFGVAETDLSSITPLVMPEVVVDGVVVAAEQRLFEGDAAMLEICEQAKLAGITIYTIAFDLAAYSRGVRVLQMCATSPSQAFVVGGFNLSEAFDSIIQDLTNLKLGTAPSDIIPTPEEAGGEETPSVVVETVLPEVAE